jgi:FkbM family methyltransferase
MINKQNNYIGNEYAFYNSILNELKVVIDVGAQSSFFTNLNCEVHYFEPCSKGFKTLPVNKHKHFANKLGLGKKNSIKKLFNETGSTYYRNNAGNHEIYEDIEVITLDSYTEQKNIQQITLLKIDTEGMELEVFLGAKQTLKKTKYIVFEFAWDTAEAANVTFQDIKNVLQDFKIFEINEDGTLRVINETSITARVRPNTNNLVAINNYL